MIITELRPFIQYDERGRQHATMGTATYRLSDYTMTEEQADAHVQLGGDVAGVDDDRILVLYGSGIGPYGTFWEGVEWRAVLEITYQGVTLNE